MRNASMIATGVSMQRGGHGSVDQLIGAEEQGGRGCHRANISY
jgi:hypothetical protein